MLSLKTVMCANAASCLLFGALFILKSSLIVEFLGGASPAPELYILILGMLLVLNGFHLLWASGNPLPRKELVLYFALGDALWVVGSIAFMISGVWITTSGGVIVTSVIAILVALFGVFQVMIRNTMKPF